MLALMVRDASSGIDLYDAGRIRHYVWEKISAGDFAGIRQLVTRPGPYERTMWYQVLVENFVSAMNYCRCRPIVLDHPLKGVDDAVAATRILGESYRGGPGAPDGRQVRVRAAMAVRSDDPRLASEVLLAEYARFRVYPDDPPADLRPTPCSAVLRELGHSLPGEVTSTEEVRRLLPLAPFDIGEQSDTWEVKSRLAAAANAFNQTLRSFLDQGESPRLEPLYYADERAKLMADLYRNAVPSPPPQLFQ